MDNCKTDLTFKDVDEGWATARLGDVCEVNPSTKELPDVFFYIDLESVEDGRILKEKVVKKENAPSRAQRVLEKNDILFQMVRPYQKNNLFFDKDGPYVASTGYAQIRTIQSPRFFYYLFHTNNFVNEVLKKCTGSNYPAINSNELSNLIIHYPFSITHSTKISSCLSSLDELITAHSQKLELLKDHKKGLMQNLFPQEGEKVPKYRFKEFEKDGEWVEITLIDTADKKVKWSFTGGPFGSNLMASDYTESGVRIIQLQNIGDGVFNDDNKIYASLEKAEELLSCNIYAGDIVISKMGDPVGRACIIPDNLHRCIMASDGIRLVVNETKYSKYFIYSLINSKRIREAIEKKATGSTRKRIGLDTLREIELIIPKSPKEQQKIASCLSSLDALITAQAEKIEQLKLHKKGLMQGLFPNPSTGSGETIND